MKYLSFALVILLSVSLWSCTKDEPPPQPSEQLVGQWKVISFTYTGTSTFTLEGETNTTPFSGVGENMDIHVSFMANPNVYTSTGDYDIALTMDIGGEKIKQNMPIRGFMGSGTWKRDGNKVEVTDKTTGEPQSAAILQLDEKTLKIQWGGNLNIDEYNNLPLTVSVNGIYIFERE